MESKAINQHIGARIRARRRQLGMSQGQLGQALGLSFQQVQKYEHGSNRIGAATLYVLGPALDVPLTYFFEELPRTLPARETDAGLDELLTVYRRLPTAIRDPALALLRSIQTILPS